MLYRVNRITITDFVKPKKKKKNWFEYKNTYFRLKLKIYFLQKYMNEVCKYISRYIYTSKFIRSGNIKLQHEKYTPFILINTRIKSESGCQLKRKSR